MNADNDSGWPLFFGILTELGLAEALAN